MDSNPIEFMKSEKYGKLSPILQYIFNEIYKNQLQTNYDTRYMPEGPMQGPGATGIGTSSADMGIQESQPATIANVVDAAVNMMSGPVMAGVRGIANAETKNPTIGQRVSSFFGNQQAPQVDPNQVANSVMAHASNQQVAEQTAQQVSQAVQDAVAAQIGLASVDPDDNASSNDGPAYRYGGRVWAQGGIVDGYDGGMDDSVQTTIEGVEPAALSHGEYVLPADVVSALGDGNTKAGVKKLEGLVSAIRLQKYGRNRQPPRMKGGIMSLLNNGKI